MGRLGQSLAGRYQVGGLLGAGGCAYVLDGYDTWLDRPVAIKQLRPEIADEAMRRRFEQEARAAARLIHPHVVAVYDSGVEAGQPYLVMERLPGRTFADRIAQAPLPPPEAAEVATDVLAALRAAHGAGLLHRDIKPGNILLTEEGSAKLADFGIAKSLTAPPGTDVTLADLTAVGLVIGTPAYLAPERLAGRPATAQSDLYAVGVVLFEALTGRKPATGDAVAGVPPRLAEVVSKALSPVAEDRYPSAGHMAMALQAAMSSEAEEATRVALPPTAPEPGGGEGSGRATPDGRRLGSRWRAASRRPVVLGALAGIAALGLVAFIMSVGPAGDGTANSLINHHSGAEHPAAPTRGTTSNSSTSSTAPPVTGGSPSMTRATTPTSGVGQSPAPAAAGGAALGNGQGADATAGPGKGNAPSAPSPSPGPAEDGPSPPSPATGGPGSPAPAPASGGGHPGGQGN